MNVLIFGASGFVGQEVARTLHSEPGLNIFEAYRSRKPEKQWEVFADMENAESIAGVINDTNPEVIINCAGITPPSAYFTKNVDFTRNIFTAISRTGVKTKRVIITGSASIYGEVNRSDFPVGEDIHRHSVLNPYASSKLNEERVAAEYARELGLEAVVMRVFNPIGINMPSKLFVKKTTDTVMSARDSQSFASIHMSRFDSERDFIDIRDVAEAFKRVTIASECYFTVYNIGSGRPISLLDASRIIVKSSGIAASHVEYIQDLPKPEPLLAGQANTERLRAIGWRPRYTFEQTVREVITQYENKK